MDSESRQERAKRINDLASIEIADSLRGKSKEEVDEFLSNIIDSYAKRIRVLIGDKTY